MNGNVQDAQIKNTKKEHDLLYKVVVIGESNVGKTALVCRYKNPYDILPSLLPTIGIDFRNIYLEVDGIKVCTQLWDTAGHERFRTMTTNFFRGSKGALLLFDVTNRITFLSLDRWIRSLKMHNLDGLEVFIIGNKIDCVAYREVSYTEGKQMANGYGMKYFETSAETGQNVDKIIELLVVTLKDRNHPFLTGKVVMNDLEHEKAFKLYNQQQKQQQQTKNKNRCCQRTKDLDD